ncbi:TetR family transcriptional regulator [Pseudomonas gingeri]|uniref:TetR/AcrR family transcriptional regulator n=1 Tax=Pseudomonas gingeri TaxID=117681 RepID=UPI0015A0C810|nr:TetR/AcrR family transcriptional regulator [Pseudomonas gingeri]NWD66096.1 TetR family transcriptional regulator [Pseudomonas gingeri]
MSQSKHSKEPVPDIQKLRRTALPRNSIETRQRILSAARHCFSCKSYENVGIREIAAEAGVDAALVNRYFGNKEGLFTEVIDGVFHVGEHLPESLENLGDFLVGQLLDDTQTDTDTGFNPLRLLLLASTSPATATMISARFHAEFVEPLALMLKGRDANLRAALIGSYVIGLATMRHLLESPSLISTPQRKAAKLVGAAIQACVGF